MMKKKQPTEESRSGAAALIDDIIEKACQLRASDIHLEPTEHNLKVRYRVDGILQSGITVHRSMMPSAISRVKVMVNIDIGESRLPQDGKMNLNVDGSDIDLRVSTMPTVYGEKAVIRLLSRDNTSLSLESLGMDEAEYTKFLSSIKRPNGLILITGPTGGGKTTTLYAALNKLNSMEKNIVTIEDPVEYQLPNINQIQVNYKSGLTFAKGLRSILRQDPDIIMVGEIRDAETARIAVQAALTGHLVFSTLHTNSAAGAVERLIDMGIEPYLVSSSLICVVAQRLLRLSCPRCKECGFTGYKGRTGVYEILRIDEDVRSLILRNAGKKEIELKAGMRTIYEAGRDKVTQGLTTEEELRRVIWEE